MDPRIDRLRGLLAIGVLLGHAFDLAYASASDRDTLIFALTFAARPFLGFICVVGFIVLSGYCIARSTERGFTLKHYTLRRITRLYPLLIVVALLTAAIELVMLGSPHRPEMWGGPVTASRVIYAATGLSGFKGHLGALAPSYTISFELMYYAVWGLALTLARGRQHLGWLAAAAMAAVLYYFGDPLRAALGTHGNFLPPLGVVMLPAWLIGAVLALYQQPLTALGRHVPVWPLWLLLGGFFMFAHDKYAKPAISTATITDVIYFTVFATFLIAAMAAWLARPVQQPGSLTDRWLGDISYPLFLVHGPTIIGVQFLMNSLNVHRSFPVTLGYLVVSSMIAALFLTMAIERPLMAWRRRGKEKRDVARRAAVPVGDASPA